MSTAGAGRGFWWTMLLTVLATALVFTFDPTQPSWPDRYLDWLEALVRLDFLDGREDPAVALAVVGVPYAVVLTTTVGAWSLALTGVIVFVRAIRRSRPWDRPEPSDDLDDPEDQRAVRPGRMAVALALVALLGWSAVTLAAVAGWIGGVVGADVLPTTTDALYPRTIDSLRFGFALLHQLVFPSLVVVVALAPVVVWWCGRQDTVIASLRVLVRLLPAFVVAAVLVELVTESFGAGRLMVGRNVSRWFEDPAFNLATAVLLLGLVTAVIQAGLAVAVGYLADPPPDDDDDDSDNSDGPADDTDGPDGTEPADYTEGPADSTEHWPAEPDTAPESLGRLWKRVMADRSARHGMVLLAGLGLAVCYARLWFDVGPNDIVSSETPLPPSTRHWLGVDALGHDQLVRLAAATVGSGSVAAGAATLATVAGLLLAVVRLPRRLATTVATVAALTAGVWLLSTFGDPAQAYGDPTTRRVDLAIAIGALLLPLTTRLLSGHRLGEQAAARAIGTWLAAGAVAVPAEQLASLILVKLDLRSPTLGTALAQTIAGTDPAGLGTLVTEPASDQPWLWYPPAVATVALTASLTLLAVAALSRPSSGVVAAEPPGSFLSV